MASPNIDNIIDLDTIKNPHNSCVKIPNIDNIIDLAILKNPHNSCVVIPNLTFFH